jgi:hypothetical protein
MWILAERKNQPITYTLFAIYFQDNFSRWNAIVKHEFKCYIVIKLECSSLNASPTTHATVLQDMHQKAEANGLLLLDK